MIPTPIPHSSHCGVIEDVYRVLMKCVETKSNFYRTVVEQSHETVQSIFNESESMLDIFSSIIRQHYGVTLPSCVWGRRKRKKKWIY